MNLQQRRLLISAITGLEAAEEPIRVYDSAGSVIETSRARGGVQRLVSSRDARIVYSTSVPAAGTSGRPIKFETFRRHHRNRKLFVVALLTGRENK